MKITTQTPDTLIIDHTPWLWGIAIGAFTVILLGTGMALSTQGNIIAGATCLGFSAFTALVFRLVVVRNQAYFHLPSGVVEMRKRKMGGSEVVQIALTDLKGAVVETLHGESPTHRLALVQHDGTTHPLTRTYYSGAGAQKAVDAITTWMAAYVDSAAAPH